MKLYYEPTTTYSLYFATALTETENSTNELHQMAALLADLVGLIIEGVSEGGAIAGEAGAIAGEGGAIAGEGGAIAGEGGAIAGEGGAIAGEGGAIVGEGGAVAGEGGAVAGEGGAVAGEGGTAAGDGVGNVTLDAGTTEATTATGGEGLGSVIWRNAQAFTKWVAKEVAKGAVFEAAMKGFNATIHAIQAASPSYYSQQMANLVTAINNAHQSLDKCTDDWLAWLNGHYDSRSSYGSVTVDGVKIQNFQIVQQKVGDLGIYITTTLSPLIVAANKAKNLDSMDDLQSGMMQYAVQVQTVNMLILKMGSMRSAGLADHSADIQSAMESLA